MKVWITLEHLFLCSFQIWNTNAAVASNATVMDKVKSVLPGLNFNKFYKRESIEPV